MSRDWRGRLRSAFRLAVANPRQLLAEIVGKGSRSYVYATRLSELPATPFEPAGACRLLSEAELVNFPYDGNPERLARLGKDRAYGAFVNGSLAHVSWLVTREIEPATGNVIGLREDEAEITACFTVPEFRGQGLYPVAIRQICEIARRAGFRTVFMKARPENVSSQRGVLKAGLKRIGTVYSWSSPLLPKGGVMLRGHRLSRI
jgi:GNAT superfamily N-acetyltransferase